MPENEHSRFWPKADACMRQAGLDPQQRLAEIQTCKSQLQNTQDETQTLEDLRKRLPAFSWKQELRDFPLFMAVYAGGLLGLYEHILVPLAEHRPLERSMAVTPGLLLQCCWVYLILKMLLTLLAGQKPGWKYWSGIIGFFCLYLAGIWCCSLLNRPVLFSLNIWLLTGILVLFAWICRPSDERRK